MKRSELKSIIKEIIAQEMALDDQPHMRVYRGTAVDEHDETDMNNSEEKREVLIGKEIEQITTNLMHEFGKDRNFVRILELTKELIQMHGAK